MAGEDFGKGFFDYVLGKTNDTLGGLGSFFTRSSGVPVDAGTLSQGLANNLPKVGKGNPFEELNNLYRQINRQGFQPANQAVAPSAPVQQTGYSQPQRPPLQPANLSMPSGGFQIDNSSPQAFINSVTPMAKQIESATGVPAAIMVAMAANETGYGRYMSGNNLFGIKGSNPTTGANTGPVTTWEDYGNGPVTIKDTFRAYDSPAGSFQDFVDFLYANSRYANALQVRNDPVAFINAIKAAGYATDPIYPQKILNIARTYGLL